MRKFNKSGKLTPALKKLEAKLRYHGKINIPLVEGCTIADFHGVEKFGKTVLLVLYSVFNSVWKQMKFQYWILLSITSLSVMSAAVIPTPAGVGAVELIMTNLFAVLVGVHKAGAITVLYRVATFIFPFVVGGVLIVISKFLHRHK